MITKKRTYFLSIIFLLISGLAFLPNFLIADSENSSNTNPPTINYAINNDLLSISCNEIRGEDVADISINNQSVFNILKDLFKNGNLEFKGSESDNGFMITFSVETLKLELVKQGQDTTAVESGDFIFGLTFPNGATVTLPISLRSHTGEDTERAAGSVVPTGLNWPISDKSVKDVYLFFDAEDAVDPGVPRLCDGKHFPKHLGIDITADPKTTKVHPIASGKVVKTGNWDYAANKSWWGNYIIISHDNNTWTSIYGHINKIMVAQDTPVTTDTVIGTIYDTTGTGDIPHLHLGIRAKPYLHNEAVQGEATEYDPKTKKTKCIPVVKYSFVDPLIYLKNCNYNLKDDNCAAYSGSWTYTNELDFYHGTGYTYLPPNYSGSATYTMSVNYSGYHSIYARWPRAKNSSKSNTNKAIYTIQQSTPYQLKYQVTKNQSSSPGVWNLLWAGFLNKGSVQVKIENSGSGYLISDAILIE